MNEEKKKRGRPKSLLPKIMKEKKPMGRPKTRFEKISPDDLAPEQAKRFKQARKLSGCSYYALSKRTGIPLSVIHRLEQGQLTRGANTATFSQLAKALGEDPGWLAFGTGKSLLAEKAQKKES